MGGRTLPTMTCEVTQAHRAKALVTVRYFIVLLSVIWGPSPRSSVHPESTFSAAVGFATPLPQSQALIVSAGLPAAVVAPLVWVASTLDLILGILALIAWRPEVVAALMCASLVIYTAFIGLLLPSVWLEPFGGILKNLPLIPAVLVMGVLARHR